MHFLRKWKIAGGILLCLVFFGGGVMLGRLTTGDLVKGVSQIEQIRESTVSKNTYKFIDPLLGCDLIETKDLNEFDTLKSQIQKVIQNRIQKKELTTASVYFDLRDGRWLGINIQERYFPASLLKVPILIGVLKMAEKDPALLEKKFVYKGTSDANAIQNYKPEKNLDPGKSYTLEDLTERMIMYSDNNALNLIVANVNRNVLDDVFTDLGVSFPRSDTVTLADFMVVKDYANFFRILYNSSYLSRDMSEKALNLLSRSNFPDGFQGGIPPGIIIAQKFGEYQLVNTTSVPSTQPSDKELHECGIIYYPGHPYLLCVMTKGEDFDALSGVIKDISRVTYDQVDKELSQSAR